MLAGGAAAAVWYYHPPTTKPVPTLSTYHREPAKPDDDRVVARLTATDALHAALQIAAAGDSDHGAAKKDPSVWKKGRAVKLAGALQHNQSISTALSKHRVPQSSIQAVVAALRPSVDFRHCAPGDHWEADVDPDGRITRFRYKRWETQRTDHGYERHTITP